MKIDYPPRTFSVLFVAAVLQICGAGCVVFDWKPFDSKSRPPGVGPVCFVEAIWETQIMETFDTNHNNRPVPGLVGRVFLFGPDKSKTVRGKGMLTVDVYDPKQLDAEGNPKLLHRWQIDKVSADRLFHAQFIFWGYTLFLPWPDYPRSATRLIVQAGYHPEKAAPIFGPRGDVTLQADPLKRTERTSAIGPTDGRTNPPGMRGSLAP